MTEKKKPDSDDKADKTPEDKPTMGDAAAADPEPDTKTDSPKTDDKPSDDGTESGEGKDAFSESAKAARERAAAAASEASEEASRAATRAREEASKSYAEAKSSISDSDDKTIAIVSYVLFLAIFVTFAVAAVVGVILSYLKKDTDDPVLANHFEYQIRTFWIGLGALAISIVCFLTIILIPLAVLIWFVTGVWWLLRNVIGLVRLLDGKPHPDTKTWLI